MVIAFIVEAFVLQLEQNNRKKEKLERKILERRISFQKRKDDTDSVEGKIFACAFSFQFDTCTVVLTIIYRCHITHIMYTYVCLYGHACCTIARAGVMLN